eukprot:gnl/MRDRNA2_/MRDRNA2_29412_c0_seq1.p1 gnl/MRDRNA2_/MRDRNA2_29412_c0~~gnl/MRDRNA2_/MRDRNA2_29412_c0_seq1.p1  ORF type:complete len:883 (-),score=171.57 gnl/MRDRNA2_/MRDRNA2_29412_c0_seq1:214-2862(-)
MLFFNHDIVCLPQMSEFTTRKEPKAPVIRAPRHHLHVERSHLHPPLAEHKLAAESISAFEAPVFDRSYGSQNTGGMQGPPPKLPSTHAGFHGKRLGSMSKEICKLQREVSAEVQDLVMDALHRVASPVPFNSSFEETLGLPRRAHSARSRRSDDQELLMQGLPRTNGAPLRPGHAGPKGVAVGRELWEEQQGTEIERLRAFELACSRRRHWDEIAAASRHRAAEEQQRLSRKSSKERSSLDDEKEQQRLSRKNSKERSSQKPALPFTRKQIAASPQPDQRVVEETCRRLLEGDRQNRPQNPVGSRRALSARTHSRKVSDIAGDHWRQQPVRRTPRPRSSNATPIPQASKHSEELIPLSALRKQHAEPVKHPAMPVDPSPSHALAHARNKLRHSMPHKQTLDMRMRNLRKRRKERTSTSTEFELIPCTLGEAECERIRETFSCYDGDGSGTLDTNELRGALADLGYCPQSREEKLRFSKILEDVDREGDGELDMKEFEQAVVRVMDMLRDLQGVELFESFHLHDVDGTGSLSIDEVFDILPDLGLAPRIDEEHDMIRQCVAKVDVDNSKEVDFNEFEELLFQVREGLHRMRRERRRSIIHQCELERGIVDAFKNEICELKDQFDCYDRDHSGFLDRSELNLLIADCGLGPRSKAEREVIQALIASIDTDNNAQVTFMEFLHLIHGIRRLNQSRCQNDLQNLFRKFDKDGSGSMSLAECSRLLEYVGLSPKTQQEQRHIGVLLSAIDEDGNGELDFEEFAHLCQRVKEMLQLIAHHQELKAAKHLNITITQLQEYKLVFEQLDTDETGQLSVEEVREMVDSLHINISGDELHEIFTSVDENNSGVIEFAEFLKLISVVTNHAARSKMRLVVGPITSPAPNKQTT